MSVDGAGWSRRRWLQGAGAALFSGVRDEAQLIAPDIVAQNHFSLELDHTASCVRDNVRPHTPGEEGLQDVRIITAIYESAQRGQAVRLPAQAGIDAFRGPAPA
jgi:predicted dehydrogenase